MKEEISKLEKETFELVKMLTESILLNKKLTPSEIKERSIGFAVEELQELIQNVDRFIIQSKDFVLYERLLSEPMKDILSRLDSYKEFIQEKDVIDLSGLSEEQSKIYASHSRIRKKMLDEISNKYLKER